ncbi:hypothetical protein [Paenibacillus sp. FSL R7-0331]|uniref:hypothetical protein n=1 Tax=Paenibacillus sp. FSL R7-0331 TaxID=1536773 RepID=UPI0004F88A92|nr:hypothetical protein [Paenibacillus sp. FSL R7-0331]AIQ55475.1 hypothetical protein R70331_31015 [Paenibacillus sp. FSL R7-0331]
MELLEEIIQKSFKTLGLMEVIKVHEAAREQAITIAILEFIPMEQHDAVTQRMEDVTRGVLPNQSAQAKPMHSK